MVEETTFDAWLNSYCAAQEAADPDALDRLFTPDARLFPGPFSSPIAGREAIKAYFARYWERHLRSELVIGKIAADWAHWTEGGTIEALQEPYRTDAILHAEINDDGLCVRLTIWQETLSARESDMLSQRDA